MPIMKVRNPDGTWSEIPAIVGPKGETGATGAAGKDGADGYTPIKGVDYWTDADQESIVQQTVTKVSAEVVVTPEIEITNGALCFGSANIQIEPHDNGKYAMVNVENYSRIKASGYQWAVQYGYYMVSFTDMAGTILAKHNPPDSTYATVELEVPSNAVYAYITGHKDGVITVEATKIVDIATLSAEKADRIAKWNTLSGDLTSGYIVYGATGNSTAQHNNGEYMTYNVSGLKKVRVVGWQYSIEYSYACCYFYDANGAYISKVFGDTEGKKTSLEIDVPDNAVTMKLNGQIYEGKAEASGYKVFDVADVFEELKPSGKKLITLGDSITALGTKPEGWVKYFIEKTGCELVANVAVNGAWLMDKDGTVYDGNPVFEGADDNVNNVLGNQVQKIINNNYPEPNIILIAIGTNAGISITKDQIKAAYYDSNNNLIALDSVDRKTSAGAYRWCLEKLHTQYPNALIFWCTPIMGYQTTRSAENAMAYAESLRIATEFTGQMLIDTIRCGINGVNELKDANGEYLADGLHPNANGAKKIGYYNAAKVIPFLQMC